MSQSIAQAPVATNQQHEAAVGPQESPQGEERRIVALDGLRGFMTILVILSHYFGELPNGVTMMMLGWLAVDMFFVLSGYLVGKLILEKCGHANFFTVFYVRRICRTIPAYVITVLAIFALLHVFTDPWIDADVRFPLWSYLTFTQGVFMVTTDSIGAHWLAPTWTLAVEEHFYLLVPAAIVFTPRRRLVHVLAAVAVAAVGLRIAVNYFDVANSKLALALLPGRADILVCGILAAIAVKAEGFPWARIDQALRVVPILCLVIAFLLQVIDPRLFQVLGHLVVSIGCAAFILSIVRGAPEAKRFHSETLRFFGNNGYCLYLTHLPILGLMHGLILGTRPDLVTFNQWLVTLAALPVCVLVGWSMTKLIEEPLTRYGRSWTWGPPVKRERVAA